MIFTALLLTATGPVCDATWHDTARNRAGMSGHSFGAHTTLFWRWTLMGDAGAKAELDRGAATIGPGDRFETR